MNRQQDQYETVGVIKNTMSSRRHPVVVMINRNKKSGSLSFMFGLLRRGRVETVRYWREDAVMEMTTLASLVSRIAIAEKLGVIEFTSSSIKELIDHQEPLLECVEEYLPGGQQKKASMTLGERASRR